MAGSARSEIFIAAVVIALAIAMYNGGFFSSLGVDFFDGYVDLGNPSLSCSSSAAGWITCPGGAGSCKNVQTCTQTYPKSFNTEDVKIFYSYNTQAGSTSTSYSTLSFGNANLLSVSSGSGATAKSSSGVIEIIHSVINPQNYIVLNNGQQIGEGTASSSDNKIRVSTQATYSGSQASAYIAVSKLKEKIPFGCSIDNTEVLVFDDFSSGSTISLYPSSTLAYQPTRFCFDNPALIVRTGASGGLQQDRYGELFNTITQGSSVSVGTGYYIRLPYITKYVEGQTLRCPVGQAYNTKRRVCEQIAYEEVLMPQIVGCVQASDCYVPSNCGNIQASCVSSKCQYSSGTCTDIQLQNALLAYQEALKSNLGTKIYYTSPTENQFIFTRTKSKAGFKVGSISVTSNLPQYTCQSETGLGSIAAGKPRESCWTTSFEYGSFGSTLVGGVEKQIDAYTSVVYRPSGDGTNPNGVVLFDSDWRNVLLFTLGNNALQVKSATPSFYEIKQYSTATIPFTVDNKISTFDSSHSGIILTCANTLFDTGAGSIDIPMAFAYGLGQYFVPLPTSRAGQVSCLLRPYIIVDADAKTRVLMNNFIQYNFNIINHEPQVVYINRTEYVYLNNTIIIPEEIVREVHTETTQYVYVNDTRYVYLNQPTEGDALQSIASFLNTYKYWILGVIALFIIIRLLK